MPSHTRVWLRRWARRAGLATAAGAAALTAGSLIAASRPRPMPTQRTAPDPPDRLPDARVVAVGGHGEFFLRDTGAPTLDGEYPVILLLHGWMFPSDLNWYTCYGPLAEIGRVLAVDLRGHGRGTRPSEPFRLTDAADDVAALLTHLGITGTPPRSGVVAVGYSMGGPVAMLLWRRHPELVRGLVLCATAATFAESPRNRWVWRAMGALQIGLRLLPRHWWERLLRAQVEGRLPFQISRMITDDLSEETLALLPWIIGELSRGSAEELAEAGRELGRFSAKGWLGQLDVPTAAIITTEDRLVPPSEQRQMAAQIRACAVHEVATDHNGVAARPELFVPALRKAIQAVWEDSCH